MTKGIFITGTGTDIGKTYISALIVKKMRELGFNCGYYKPALSGAYRKNDKLVAGDCEYVQQISGLCANPNDFASYIFEPALSPHLASKIENNPIKLEKIISDFNKHKKNYDYIVVEGAGGIVCPFNADEGLLLADIIKALDLDVLIVSNAKLGAINSAVLTYEYAKSRNIDIKGFILNDFDKTSDMQIDNKKMIEKLTGQKILCEVSIDEGNLSIKNDTLISIFKEL